MSKPILIEKVDGKIDTSQIKNTLTETTTGNVLDASQGKVLNDKIDILNSYSIINYGTLQDATNLNSIQGNKIYILNPDYSYVNCPNLYGNWAVLEVIDKISKIYTMNIEIIYFTANNSNSTIIWQQIANESEYNVTLLNGWKTGDACGVSCTKIGNRIYLSGIIVNPSFASNNTIAQLQPPRYGQWYGGVAVSSDNIPKYFCIDPSGYVIFQHGYEQGAYYSISLDYPI